MYQFNPIFVFNEFLQWLLHHLRPFSADDLDLIDQQVAEWADHDTVDTYTPADWEQLNKLNGRKE